MSSDFTLRQIEYFEAAARLGSITAAAQACHASQAAVSLAVADLEKNLAVQLLVRRKAKGVVLTDAGARVLSDARRVLEAAGELRRDAHSLSNTLHGTLTVGCYVTLAPFVIPPVLDEFAARHPSLTVTVIEGAGEEMRDALVEGRCEVAFLYADDSNAPLTTTTVQTTTPYVILSAEHPLAHQESISLSDVADLPLIMFDAPSARNAAQMLRSEGLSPNIRHVTPNIELVRCLVARGLGYSILVQKWPVDVSYEGKPLVALPIRDSTDVRRVVLAWPEAVKLTRRAATLIEAAQDLF
ncbi:MULTISPECIES: LysR family transcriptional regulator [Rhodococcus]|uniref:LysR family transcriptional regulator n=1 Tax=Rhodococcus sp. A14 TaxID=1194106 RepID=UPI001063731C|nr:LysR family transcriptional regulator [Rhodococcus sp. A14]RYF59862.1 MAG: LysR family transcriptional regulator [Comamonadaceae bacterium]